MQQKDSGLSAEEKHKLKELRKQQKRHAADMFAGEDTEQR